MRLRAASAASPLPICHPPQQTFFYQLFQLSSYTEMNSENRSPREHDPLLAPIRRTASSPTKDQTTKTVLCSLVTVAFISMSYAFIEAPIYRLYESVICKRYYREHEPSVISPAGRIPEERCKMDSIQQELAVLLTKQAQMNLCACKHVPRLLRIMIY
jgi:hypothetical protein